MGTAQKSAALGVVEEIPIFEKNLEMPSSSQKPSTPPRDHGEQADDATRILNALGGPPLVFRAMHKVVRLLSGKKRTAA